MPPAGNQLVKDVLDVRMNGIAEGRFSKTRLDKSFYDKIGLWVTKTLRFKPVCSAMKTRISLLKIERFNKHGHYDI